MFRRLALYALLVASFMRCLVIVLFSLSYIRSDQSIKSIKNPILSPCTLPSSILKPYYPYPPSSYSSLLTKYPPHPFPPIKALLTTSTSPSTFTLLNNTPLMPILTILNILNILTILFNRLNRELRLGQPRPSIIRGSMRAQISWPTSLNKSKGSQ